MNMVIGVNESRLSRDSRVAPGDGDEASVLRDLLKATAPFTSVTAGQQQQRKQQL